MSWGGCRQGLAVFSGERPVSITTRGVRPLMFGGCVMRCSGWSCAQGFLGFDFREEVGFLLLDFFEFLAETLQFITEEFFPA